MAYGLVAEIRLLTGWTTSQIPDANIDEFIAVADTFIDAFGTNLSTTEKTKASNLLSCHFGELYLHGNKSSISIKNVSASMRDGTDPASWLGRFNALLKSASTDNQIIKVNG